MLYLAHMKKYIFLAVALLALLGACSGSKSNSGLDEEDWIYDEDTMRKYPLNYPYTIIGKVECEKCTKDSYMHVNIEDEDDRYLINTPWNGTFGDGTYKFSDVTLEAGKRVHFRVFIDGLYPSGKKSELVTLPEDNSDTVSVPTVTIP